jgi:hypothetical protein
MAMETCPCCHKQIPDWFDRCPHCKTMLAMIPCYTISLGCLSLFAVLGLLLLLRW